MVVFGVDDNDIVGVLEVMLVMNNFCSIFDIGSDFVLFVLG